MDYAIGCDIGGSFVKIGLVSREGTLLSRSVVPLPKTSTPDMLARWLSSTLSKFLEKRLDRKKSFLGAGIGIPGPVQIPEGILFDPPNLPFNGEVPFGKLFAAHFPHPTFFDNDATAQTLGEAWQGLGRGIENFIYIALGTGIGGGIVIGGKIYRGTSGMGGEIGHMTIDYNGRKCLCGSKGCLETYASLNGLVYSLSEMEKPLPKDLQELINTGQKQRLPQLLEEKIKHGETHWQHVWDIFAEALGAGIGSLINLFNPQRIILSGGLSFYSSLFLSRTIEHSKKYCFSKPAKECKILVSDLKDRAGILGAARLVFIGRMDD